ncbi:MAG: HTH domain-containing protein, partial [Pseudomonadales bacterium]|nr:HTH domain-containing protein [Pseudomonadales bacterium]
MLSQQALLTVLSDGEWHSGEDLGAHFNVSRAAIWKQLKQLQTAGVALESERGKGYCLSNPVQLLDGAGINAALNPQAQSQL